MSNRIYNNSQIDERYLKLMGRQEPFNNIYIGGTFDCLHRGHIALFENAKKIAIKLTVSLNDDDFAERYKRRPLIPFEDRWCVVSALNMVDRVLHNTGGEDSRPSIKTSGCDAIGHGDDWVGEALKKQMGLTDAWLMENGIAMVYLPYTTGVSTSDLRGLTSGQGAG